MRPILAAALIAAALPAQAQRLDTSRTIVERKGEWITCNFNAYPELQLVDNPYGGIGSWGKSPEGAAPGDGIRMVLIFSRAENWRRPKGSMLVVAGRLDPELGAVASGRLRIEGAAPAALRFASKDDEYLLMADNSGIETVYALIDHAKRAEVDLLDADGTVLRSYGWDTSRLTDAVETVSVAGWSCTSP
jgi:hypothetical protein